MSLSRFTRTLSLSNLISRRCAPLQSLQSAVKSTLKSDNLGTSVQISRDTLEPLDDSDLAEASEIERRELMRTAIVEVDEAMDITSITGVPEEHIKTRRARIFQPPKNAMQSGTNDTKRWILEFEQRQRWENPNMGWTSSGDPMSNLRLAFTTREDAAVFCEKNGWTYFVEEPRVRRNLKPNYSANYAWNKRSRTGTK